MQPMCRVRTSRKRPIARRSRVALRSRPTVCHRIGQSNYLMTTNDEPEALTAVRRAANASRAGLPNQRGKPIENRSPASTVARRWLETTPRGPRRSLPPPWSPGRRRLTGRPTPPRVRARPLPLRLEVRLDHPEPFVHASRDLDEDVVGVLVVDVIALLDGAADELAERRQRGGEGVYVLPPAPDLHRVFGERRSLRDGPRRAFDHPAQLDGPLGDQVDVLFDVVVHLVEQLKEGDEMRPLHVPMRLLRLRLQIYGVGEPRVAQVDHLPPRRFW